MHHRVLVRKPLKTAWLNVPMRPQRFDGSIYDAAVASPARSGNAQPSITRQETPRMGQLGRGFGPYNSFPVFTDPSAL